MSRITVVIPVYNEEACLEALFERLQRLNEGQPDDYDFLFVDDGSRDNSREIIRSLAQGHPAVRYLFFSRNFGHEMATTAGLDHADGDAVVIIDADLQDPPEVIPRLVERWREGNEVVYAKRKTRKGENVLKRFTAWLFYRLINKLSDVPIPADTGDFRLMDRQVVEGFRRCRERNRFVRGLVSWTGFRQTAVEYERDARAGGETKYGFFKLLRLTFDAVTGFSSVPLRIGVMLGLVVCVVAFIQAVRIFVEKMFWGIPIEGYALLATGIFFLGGVQLLVIGLLGEYIGRIYTQVQERPLYIVREKSDVLPAVDPERDRRETP
ncbi:MAG TPA: glycosyltransferase family 2 protein [Planctomycetota bacterium]|nr:glycosyltransferase family 2 protein [Planctomycetota bacterium]